MTNQTIDRDQLLGTILADAGRMSRLTNRVVNQFEVLQEMEQLNDMELEMLAATARCNALLPDDDYKRLLEEADVLGDMLFGEMN